MPALKWIKSNLPIGVALVAMGVGLVMMPPMRDGHSMPTTAAPVGPKTDLHIETAEGKSLLFHVELASNREERELGLMFRTYLAPDDGMLFIYPEATQMSFWMKNTLISLDLLFIKPDGHIANIIESAEPETLTHRDSAGEVIAGLELPAGTAARLHIKAGDLVRHATLHNDLPVPPPTDVPAPPK